jgi:hypothetical protein
VIYSDHDHGGEYADLRHDHDNDYAPLHHRHYDLEKEDDRLRDAIRDLGDALGELRGELQAALERIRVLEGQTPQARQLQLEADQAAADLAESGYDRHGRDCGCPFCYYDPEEDGNEGQADEPGYGSVAIRRFVREHPLSPDDYVQRSAGCAETSNGMHCGDWNDGGRCGACGLLGPRSDDEPEPEEYDPRPEIDDEGGMSEYRYMLPEDHERGQS